MSFAFAATSCIAFSPRAPIESPARALGIPTRGDGCARSAEAIADDVDARWARGESGGPSAKLPDDARGDYACLALESTMARDSMVACGPPPEDLFDRPLPARRRVVGDLAYVGIDPREYAYDLVPEPDGKLGVELRIAFRGHGARDAHVLGDTQRKLDEAARIWTASSPGGAMRFRFRAVTLLENPHYEIDLVPGEPRTPFDLTWGEDWSAHLIAHEVGHMMGLDDEYPQVRKTAGHALGREPAWRADPRLRLAWFRCDLGSLMCDSKGETSVPLPHHYYLIARRRYCRTQSAGFAF